MKNSKTHDNSHTKHFPVDNNNQINHGKVKGKSLEKGRGKIGIGEGEKDREE